MQADFGGDAFLGQWLVFEQRQFAAGGQVQNMQSGAVTPGQFYGHRRGAKARLGVADQRVGRSWKVFAVGQ